MHITHIAEQVYFSLDKFLRAVFDSSELYHEVRILNVNLVKQNKLLQQQLDLQSKLLQELIYLADKKELK